MRSAALMVARDEERGLLIGYPIVMRILGELRNYISTCVLFRRDEGMSNYWYWFIRPLSDEMRWFHVGEAVKNVRFLQPSWNGVTARRGSKLARRGSKIYPEDLDPAEL